jgi:hypothetical protein
MRRYGQLEVSSFSTLEIPVMRRVIVALCLSAGFLLTGCAGIAQSGVQPGGGPAITDEPLDTEPPLEVGDEPSEQPQGPDNATFNDEYTYSDGLQIEVIKVVNATFMAAQAEYRDDVKRGQPYTVMTVRVKNGTPKTVELMGSATVTYGPDGTEAETSYAEDRDISEGLDGKLLKGKSRSARYVFLIPPKHLDDVVLEFSPDFEHDSAMFSGSIK